jgi:hypothetical protein
MIILAATVATSVDENEWTPREMRSSGGSRGGSRSSSRSSYSGSRSYSSYYGRSYSYYYSGAALSYYPARYSYMGYHRFGAYYAWGFYSLAHRDEYSCCYYGNVRDECWPNDQECWGEMESRHEATGLILGFAIILPAIILLVVCIVNMDEIRRCCRRVPSVADCCDRGRDLCDRCSCDFSFCKRRKQSG